MPTVPIMQVKQPVKVSEAQSFEATVSKGLGSRAFDLPDEDSGYNGEEVYGNMREDYEDED